MSPADIRTALETLSEPLLQKVLALPSGSTVGDFDAWEQAELVGVFGSDWATVLGVGA